MDLKQEEELRETLGNRWEEENARDRMRDTPSSSIYSGFGYFPKTPLDTLSELPSLSIAVQALENISHILNGRPRFLPGVAVASTQPPGFRHVPSPLPRKLRPGFEAQTRETRHR